MERAQEKFDVAVIGGGPAGMMAAGRVAEFGANVVLIEKNKSLGKKFLMSGNGRCNISNAEFNDRKFVEKLGKKGQFLLSALSVFGPEEVVDFFESRGLKTKIEKDGRIFPVSDKSQEVLNILIKYLDENKVKLLLNQEVAGFEVQKGKIESVKLTKGEIFAQSFVLCAGGKSYPQTGSNGDGYAWIKKMGHKIINPTPALSPIETKENWVSDIKGLSLKNVSVALFQNDKKQCQVLGEMIFTHFGLSGPIILNLSKKMEELLANGEVILKIDIMPALSSSMLDKKLQEDFKRNKIFKNYLSEIIPQRLSGLIVKFSKIAPDKKLNSITREERKKIIEIIKGVKLTPRGSVGFSQAVVTSGGVDLREIESKTMRSKIIKNLFFAGEIIDLDGPTGGYNLQICWSTGRVAGENAGKI
ncbi:MAG: NAD(P)/FAD-dependent oxidoreductase [bacterium]|nr:NAD(P)/FAD-dependent oxidoreductase [bacterium]